MTARLLLASLTVGLALSISVGQGRPDENVFGGCPDRYTPAPFIARLEADRNGNGVICIKFVDAHENVKDDPNGRRYRCNGFPVPPPECIEAALDDGLR